MNNFSNSLLEGKQINILGNFDDIFVFLEKNKTNLLADYKIGIEIFLKKREPLFYRGENHFIEKNAIAEVTPGFRRPSNGGYGISIFKHIFDLDFEGPPRNNSLMFTQDESHTEYFSGNISYVIPKDGAILAFTEEDFNMSGRDQTMAEGVSYKLFDVKNTSSFFQKNVWEKSSPHIIDSIIKTFARTISKIKDKDLENIAGMCLKAKFLISNKDFYVFVLELTKIMVSETQKNKSLEKKLNKYFYQNFFGDILHKNASQIIETMGNSKYSIIEFFKDLTNIKYLKGSVPTIAFTQQNYQKYFEKNSYQEIWTSDPCLLINL